MLDLDNTGSGGANRYDGMEEIQIGRETGVAEAYTAFQEDRQIFAGARHRSGGVVEETSTIAKWGFEHPDSLLETRTFRVFQATGSPNTRISR